MSRRICKYCGRDEPTWVFDPHCPAASDQSLTVCCDFVPRESVQGLLRLGAGTASDNEGRLVRCGCGVVRNDEDPLVQIAFNAHKFVTREPGNRPMDVDSYEQPRVCRGCGCVYMLPKPQAPTVPT